MVLAAGLGTRLRHLTSNRPKALVEVAGRTLLEVTLTRLRTFGIREVIINVHHFADMLIAYLQANRNFGMNIAVSREDVLLDTGGGLKNAAWFFQDGVDEPFILRNVDILSSIDLALMVEEHKKSKALATLAVQSRKTSRYLLFDQEHRLCGRRSSSAEQAEIVRPSEKIQELAFCGVHVISPRILRMIKEDGVFSIINSYLALAAKGENISAFRADAYYWRDLGKPENIQQATDDVQHGRFSL